MGRGGDFVDETPRGYSHLLVSAYSCVYQIIEFWLANLTAIHLYSSNGISKLAPEVQSALRTLSLFGSFTKVEYIKAMEQQLNVKIAWALDIAVSEGLITCLKGSYPFSHDRSKCILYQFIFSPSLAVTQLPILFFHLLFFQFKRLVTK